MKSLEPRFCHNEACLYFARPQYDKLCEDCGFPLKPEPPKDDLEYACNPI